eukprot:TRINITY_DN1361_c0_g1_i4.p1 TRINITY_DN1361_c0_g1~~TRINITY_DN1361_c0_g1_i4.p1  ORF type:complete len:1057 (-),score=147.75 TRINITY_DN1361_c0_g1_i4:36-3206(-)
MENLSSIGIEMNLKEFTEIVRGELEHVYRQESSNKTQITESYKQNHTPSNERLPHFFVNQYHDREPTPAPSAPSLLTSVPLTPTPTLAQSPSVPLTSSTPTLASAPLTTLSSQLPSSIYYPPHTKFETSKPSDDGSRSLPGTSAIQNIVSPIPSSSLPDLNSNNLRTIYPSLNVESPTTQHEQQKPAASSIPVTFTQESQPPNKVSIVTESKWVPDSSVASCRICSKPFTLLFRRHHCRMCLKIVCGQCSPEKVAIKNWYNNKPVRICNSCNSHRLCRDGNISSIDFLTSPLPFVSNSVSPLFGFTKQEYENISTTIKSYIVLFEKNKRKSFQSNSNDAQELLMNHHYFLDQYSFWNLSPVLFSCSPTVLNQDLHSNVQFKDLLFDYMKSIHPIGKSDQQLYQSDINSRMIELMSDRLSLDSVIINLSILLSCNREGFAITSSQPSTKGETTDLILSDREKLINIAVTREDDQDDVQNRWSFNFLNFLQQKLGEYSSDKNTLGFKSSLMNMASQSGKYGTGSDHHHHHHHLGNPSSVFTTNFQINSRQKIKLDTIFSSLDILSEYFKTNFLFPQYKLDRYAHQNARYHLMPLITKRLGISTFDNVEISYEQYKNLKINELIISYLSNCHETTFASHASATHPRVLPIHWFDRYFDMMMIICWGIQLSVLRQIQDSMNNKPSSPYQQVPTLSYNHYTEVVTHKLSNNTDTSSATTIFSDYAPTVFRYLRSHYGITDDEYVSSISVERVILSLIFEGKLCSFYNDNATGSKSGSLFFYTHNKNYIIKTVSENEFTVLFSNLRSYYCHLTSEKSLLIPIFGLHQVYIPNLNFMNNNNNFNLSNYKSTPTTLYIITMPNLFSSTSIKVKDGHPSNYRLRKTIHTCYDLKGSEVGRVTLNKDRKPNPLLSDGSNRGNTEIDDSQGHVGAVLLKDLDFQRVIKLNENIRASFTYQLHRDSYFLSNSLGTMDYSLLVGIQKINPNEAVNKYNVNNDIGVHGLLSKDNEEIFYVGIVDYLVPFGSIKMLEHKIKSLTTDFDKISVAPPDVYSNRFVDFLLKKFV